MKRLAVIGHPVAHSRSPAMQTAALEALGLADEWSYAAIDIDPEEVEQRVRALSGQGYVGINVTVPHKRTALELADEASERAAAIGAANTLSFEDGRILAENTDAPGLLAAIAQPVDGRRALVLGAGGAARAVVWALLGAGARVDVWNRTAERAAELAPQLGAESLGAERPQPGLHDLIVNTTTVGMAPEAGSLPDLPLDPDALGAGTLVVDLVYSGKPTELITLAGERGADTVDGLEVLVRQGAESMRIWTGLDAPLDVMRAAARA